MFKSLSIFADDMIDKAATLMRILYINDLRVLQSQIDDAIVGVQVSFLNKLTTTLCETATFHSAISCTV